jgi:hypothetical protein
MSAGAAALCYEIHETTIRKDLRRAPFARRGEAIPDWLQPALARCIFCFCRLHACRVDHLTRSNAARASEGLFVPSSMLVASILMSFYLMPFISTRRQVLGVRPEGLELVGHHSRMLLPWKMIADVRFKRVMLLMPYLVIRLSNNDQLARFIAENPRSFLSKWTAHVAILRWYPWVLRRLFSVPSKMSTLAMLEWLERRYGGSIVMDFAAQRSRSGDATRDQRPRQGGCGEMK